MKAENFELIPHYCTIQGKDFHTDEVISIDMNSGGVVLSCSKDGFVGLINTNSKKVIGKLQISEDSIETVEFCKEMTWFLVASMSGDLRVYECDNMSARTQISLGYGIVKALWAGMEIYACGTEGCLECYDGRNGERLRKYVGSQETLLDIDVKQ